MDEQPPNISEIRIRPSVADKRILILRFTIKKVEMGLHLLVYSYSTGLKFLGEGEWKRKKYQPEYRRQWRKFHIGIDAETLQICAVQLTT